MTRAPLPTTVPAGDRSASSTRPARPSGGSRPVWPDEPVRLEPVRLEPVRLEPVRLEPVPGDERRVPPPAASEWWHAIQTGDTDRVSGWLDGPEHVPPNDPRRAVLNLKNQIGQTALGWLVENHDLADAAVRLLPVLLARGSRPLGPDQTVFTQLSPFWAAMEHPDERVARTMWDHPDPSWMPDPPWLYMAVNEGCEAIVLHRLMHWGVPVDRTTPAGETALFAVFRTWSTSHQLGLIEPLLAARTDPRIRNHQGLSPLAYVQGRVRDNQTMAPDLERLRALAHYWAEHDALTQTVGETLPRVPALAPRRRL